MSSGRSSASLSAAWMHFSWAGPLGAVMVADFPSWPTAVPRTRATTCCRMTRKRNFENRAATRHDRLPWSCRRRPAVRNGRIFTNFRVAHEDS